MTPAQAAQMRDNSPGYSLGLEAFTVAEVAERLFLTKGRVLQLLRSNAFPAAYRVIHGVWVIPRASLDEFMTDTAPGQNP